ncbi:MAG: hypothetical protein JJE04_03095 [Acidobacteriia bacterium]|nr:hypothetical protein [Terriglobia bacterium]
MASAGTRVALQIWGDDPEAPMVQDPRRAEFANAVIDALAQSLQSAPGVLQRVMSGVASAADEVALQWGVLPDEEINALLDFLKMTRSGVPSRSG